jgi:hypothetical protein
MKLNALLTTVFNNLGVDISDPKTQSILGNPNLANLEFPEELSNRLTESKFYTKESALQNPEIRNTIRAEALNGVDSLIGELGKKYELDHESLDAINAQDKSSKKYQKLVDSIAETQAKKYNASGKDKDALNKQLEDLNAQMVKMRDKHSEEIRLEKNARKTDRLNWELDSIYNGIDYSMEAPKNVAKKAARTIVEELAREKGISFDLGEDSLRMVTKDGTEYFDNNVKISPADYIKRTLAENKLLKTSPGTQAPTSTQKTGYEMQSRPEPKYDFFNRNNPPQIPTGSSFEQAMNNLKASQATPANPKQ